MGKMKATIPDYPTVEYTTIGEPGPWGIEVYQWAMDHALREVKPADVEPWPMYFKRVQGYAQFILLTLKDLNDDTGNVD